jgi:hypothetical protein
MVKTKLDETDPQHQLLIGILAMFIDIYGYSPRELFQLLDDSKNQLWFAFQDMANEKKGEE